MGEQLDVEAIRANHEPIRADPEYVKAGGPEWVCPFCGDSCETIGLLDALAVSEAARQEAREALRHIEQRADRLDVEGGAQPFRIRALRDCARAALDSALDSGHQEGGASHLEGEKK